MFRSLQRTRAGDRGAINWVVLGTIALVSGLVYLAIAYLPHWMDNRRVLAAMREAAYQGWRVQDDDQIRRMIRSKTDRLVRIPDGAGDFPAIDESMIWIGREDGEITIELSYEVPMELPGLEEVRWIAFDNRVSTDLSSPLAD